MTQLATVKSAYDVRGHILHMGGKYYFRVYNYDKDTFIDYDLTHLDLYVQIKDLDAFFYSTATGLDCLDYSPETLGKQ